MHILSQFKKNSFQIFNSQKAFINPFVALIVFIVLIVIAFFVILFLFNVDIFNSIKGSSNDSKRKSDLQAMSQLMELNYQSSPGICAGQEESSNGGTYCPLIASQFKGVFPTDPGKLRKYCINYSTTSEQVIANPTEWAGMCPEGWWELKDGLPVINTKAWRICIYLEGTKDIQCVGGIL